MVIVVNGVVGIVRARLPYGHDGPCGSDWVDARVVRRGGGGGLGRRREHCRRRGLSSGELLYYQTLTELPTFTYWEISQIH